MTIREYTLSGERITRETDIEITREIQELLDSLWNTSKQIDFQPHIQKNTG